PWTLTLPLSWTLPRLDPAPHSNSFIFEGLHCKPGCGESRQRAPWNSHSKVSCPASSEIQVSRCAGLVDGQNPALDHRETPYPRQDIVRTFRVFYDRVAGSPGSALCLSCLGFGCLQGVGTVLVFQIRRDQRGAGSKKLLLHGGVGRRKIDK